MHTVDIPDIDFHLDVPAHWDEMDCTQRYYCLKQAVFATLGMISPREAKVRCLYHLLGVERTWKDVARDRLLPEGYLEDKYSKIVLLADELIGFLFRENEKRQLEMNYDTVMNHFPEIRCGKVTVHGPAHLLSDLSMGEFRSAVAHLREYTDGRDKMALSRMIACLYRPEREDFAQVSKSEDFDGYRRQPFNRNKIEENAAIIGKMGEVHRTIILLWFTYCIQYIQKDDLMIEGEEVNFSMLFPGAKVVDDDSEARKSGAGWIHVLHAISKEGPFGDIEKTDKAGFFDVLFYMLNLKIENDKLKAKMKRK